MAGNSTIAQTIDMNNQIANAVVTFRNREEQVNGSICNISSLEVYRGREQAIEIDYRGFSLTENGTIKVYQLLIQTDTSKYYGCPNIYHLYRIIKLFLQIHIDHLVYNFEVYMGELYRMNLSCSGGGLPESGCLFFKVFGSTNISEG